jgi:hypothetical protein
MADEKEGRDSLRSFNPYADRNGQDFGQDSPLDVARPKDLQRALNEDPGWQAETARIASDEPRLDSITGGSVETVEATEAETPAENLRHISDATLSPADKDATAQAIERMSQASNT